MTGQFYNVNTVKEMSGVLAMKKLYMRDDYNIGTTTSP
jgi:hypothetical protein